MQRLIFIIIIVLLPPNIILAYNDPSGINLIAPTALKTKQAELKFEHRFYGKIDQDSLDTLFGMNSGANVGLNLVYSALPNFGIYGSYIKDNSEVIIGASYAYFYPNMMFRSQLDAQFYSYEESAPETLNEERGNNAFALLSLQIEPILKRIIPIVNIGYDSENKKIGIGSGFHVILLERRKTVRRVSLIGEFFPTRLNENDRCYDFGFRIETYGHNFDFIFSNNSEISARRLMMGADKDTSRDIFFGFNIKRLVGQ